MIEVHFDGLYVATPPGFFGSHNPSKYVSIMNSSASLRVEGLLFYQLAPSRRSPAPILEIDAGLRVEVIRREFL